MARILTLFVSFLLFGFCSPTWAGEFETKIAPMLERMEEGKETFIITHRARDGAKMLVSKPYRSEKSDAVFVFNPSATSGEPKDFRFGFLYAMGEEEPMATLARWDFLSGKLTILEDEWFGVGEALPEVESAMEYSSTNYVSAKLPNAEPTSTKTTLAVLVKTFLDRKVPRMDTLEVSAKGVIFHPYPLPSYGYGDRSFATVEKEDGVLRMVVMGIDCKKRSIAVIAGFPLTRSMYKSDEDFRQDLAKLGFKPKENLREEFVKPFVKDFCSR